MIHPINGSRHSGTTTTTSTSSTSTCASGLPVNLTTSQLASLSATLPGLSGLTLPLPRGTNLASFLASGEFIFLLLFFKRFHHLLIDPLRSGLNDSQFLWVDAIFLASSLSSLLAGGGAGGSGASSSTSAAAAAVAADAASRKNLPRLISLARKDTLASLK